MKYERDVEARNVATCHCPCVEKMEIACIEAAACGASFLLEVIFIGDTVLFFGAASASISSSVGFEKIENLKCILVFRNRLGLFLCLSGILCYR